MCSAPCDNDLSAMRTGQRVTCRPNKAKTADAVVTNVSLETTPPPRSTMALLSRACFAWFAGTMEDAKPATAVTSPARTTVLVLATEVMAMFC